MRQRTRQLEAVVGLIVLVGILPIARPEAAAAVSPDVVISQVYGGAGCTTAGCSTYTHDYVELFNRGASSVNLGGWSIQYGSAAGNIGTTGDAGLITPLPSFSLAPGKYVLIQEGSGAGGTMALPLPFLTDPTPINMGASAGKIALVGDSTPLNCGAADNPCGAVALPRIRDLVGYGSANWYEGAGPAPAPTSNAHADFRASNGCTDTDNNVADFAVASANPRTNANNPALCGGPVTPSLSIDDVSQAEGDSGTTTFTFSVTLSSPAGGGGVTFDVSTADGTANDGGVGEDSDYLGEFLMGQSIPSGSSGPYNVSVTVNGDTAEESDETFFVYVSNITGANGGDTQGQGTIEDDDTDHCALPYTPIHVIQGPSTSTPFAGSIVTTEGVVVGDFEGPTTTGLQGFWIQEPTPDSNAATSEGIFVFSGNTAYGVSVGELVRVTGTAGESFERTQISSVTSIVTCPYEGNPPDATSVALPFPDAAFPERYEGMLVSFRQSLVISEYFNYDRFGELVLALPLDGESRPFTGTEVDAPGAAANARTATNRLSRITLDDGLGAQNPSTLRHPNGNPFSLTNRFRGGDTVAAATGVLDYAFGLYRIQPTFAAHYTSVNPRPAVPNVGGRIQVASMNTLNFFITPDYPNMPVDPNDNACGPTQNVECRGHDADQPNEFTRQRDKLLAALVGLDAEIVGLNELENTTGVDPLGGPNGLVPGLNTLLGAGTYDYIDTGVIGTDAIRVGLIYKPGAVTPIGNFEILDSSDDPRFIDTLNRPVLAQTFRENATGAYFTVAVNHLKSKGSDCNSVGDPDMGDGQGNCNGTRTLAAQALVSWLAQDPTRSGDPDFLIIGDLNAYTMENPVAAIYYGADEVPSTADDFIPLVLALNGSGQYSYLFDAQFGSLDHAFASANLFPQVTGASAWHINADEPDVLDYDTSNKPPTVDAIYEPNAFRSSDHDPLLIGLNLTGCAAQPFPDVPADLQFCGDIRWVAANGITTGFPDGTYRPAANVTRQAMAAFLARLAGADPSPCTYDEHNPPPFLDVPTSHPFCAQIKWVYENGIAGGFPDGTFRPSANITRQAMAAFLTRIAGVTPSACTQKPFTDVELDHQFCPHINWAKANNIAGGFPDGTFRPSLNVTRQAMAAFLARTAAHLP